MLRMAQLTQLPGRSGQHVGGCGGRSGSKYGYVTINVRPRYDNNINAVSTTLDFAQRHSKEIQSRVPNFILCSPSCLHVRIALPAFPAHRTSSTLLSAWQLQHALLPRPRKHVQPNPGILFQTFESGLTNSPQASHDSVLF
jgi:hypothetical protein